MRLFRSLNEQYGPLELLDFLLVDLQRVLKVVNVQFQKVLVAEMHPDVPLQLLNDLLVNDRWI